MAPRKHYKQEQMNNAIKAVRRGQTVLAAAKRFGVPRITLRNKITGISPLVCGMGPPSILTKEQEKIFVEWIHEMSDKQCPVGKEHLLDSVQYFVTHENIVNPFTDNRPGKKWYYSFSKRNPEVSERISKNWWKSKENITETKIRTWYTNVKKYLRTNNLHDILKDPRRIFTSDEAAFFLNPKHDRALVKRSETNIYSAIGNDKENPKVYLTANAAGELAPPMVMYAYQRVPTCISESIPEEWGIGRSKMGWMSTNNLYEYMTDILHPWIMENNITLPVIYFLDGDGTHLSMHLSEFCSSNQIELLCLYPNSNHLLKTMDVAIFRPLKAFWKRQCTIWKLRNYGHHIKNENFAPNLEEALSNITSDCIRNGFKVTGIFPFTHKNIDFLKLNSVVRSKVLNPVPFLNTLEKEIVQLFTREKLDQFNTYFHMKGHNSENDLPKEDITLYAIWAKYKNAVPSNNVSEAANTSIPKALERSRSSNPEYGITTHNERCIKIRRSPSNDENDLEQVESEDEKPSYLNLSRDGSESPSKDPPVTFIKLFEDDNEDLQEYIRRLKEPLTTKSWQDNNTRQMDGMEILHEKGIKQEPLETKRKIDFDTSYTHNVNKNQKAIKRRKTSVIDEDEVDMEESISEYYSEGYESIDTKESPDLKDVIKKYEIEGPMEKASSSMDLVKPKVDDDNVIIYVTDDDVKIMYYEK